MFIKFMRKFFGAFKSHAQPTPSLEVELAKAVSLGKMVSAGMDSRANGGKFSDVFDPASKMWQGR